MMLFFENLSMQAMVLMAGATGDVNALAAQVIVVSIGELLLTFPYGLSLSAAAFVGNAMGARRPALAKSNSRIFFVFSALIALAVCLSLSHYRHSIITLYGATLDVRNIADPTLRVFAIVFFWDWVQNSLGGIIKGVGQQAIASVASLFCMLCLNLPIGYLIGLHREAGLPGLWTGFGISCSTLAALYAAILFKLDWKQAALKASEDETKMNDCDVS